MFLASAHGLGQESPHAGPPPAAVAGDPIRTTAPIGVAGSHVLAKGEWTISAHVQRMELDGLLDGTDGLSAQAVLGQGYAATPTAMELQTLVLGAMVAPSDRLTLSALVPHHRKLAKYLTGVGESVRTESEGLGDIRLSALVPLHRTGRLGGGEEGELVHLEGGLSLPTGSIDERGVSPQGADAKLSYPLQLGSGTTDLVLGVTAQRSVPWGGYGVQTRGVFRLGENDAGYTLGDAQLLTGWVTYGLGDRFDTSLRLAYVREENVDGADSELDAAVAPTADPSLRARQRAELGAGLSGRLGAARLSIEALVPFWQDLDGPQLELDITAVFAVRVTF